VGVPVTLCIQKKRIGGKGKISVDSTTHHLNWVGVNGWEKASNDAGKKEKNHLPQSSGFGTTGQKPVKGM